MGLFDNDQKEKHEKAYAEGQKAAENQDLIGGAFHALGDIVLGGMPGETTEHKSFEAGYHSKEK